MDSQRVFGDATLATGLANERTLSSVSSFVLLYQSWPLVHLRTEATLVLVSRPLMRCVIVIRVERGVANRASVAPQP